MGIFAEARGGLDRFSKLCGLNSFNRRGAALKKSKTQSFLSRTVSLLASDQQQGKPSMIKYKSSRHESLPSPLNLLNPLIPFLKEPP